MKLKSYLTAYHPSFARSLVYMLQSNEYDVAEYLAWFWRAPDLRRVAHRQQLDVTPKAKLLLAAANMLILAQITVIIATAWVALAQATYLLLAPAAALIALLPLITALTLAVPLVLGQVLIQKPRERTIVARSTARLKTHSAFRIAIAGSYGKTTFKENLLAILSQGKKVAATPGNMNTPLGISRFIEHLKGDEDILIFELGEYYPGDIARLCQLTRPQLGIITGVNEAHLSKFKTLEATTATIFELADCLPDGPVYKNGQSALVRARVTANDPLAYTDKGVGEWRVSDVDIALTGTTFTAHRPKTAAHPATTIHAASRLLGAHHIGPLVAAIDIATNLGLTPAQIEQGIAATKPFEHRMQPRPLAGATIIDDTYNGNIDGVKTALALLATLPAHRRIYVTPGLVEQGAKTAGVHETIGRLIAGAHPHIVVLMKNSVTSHIVHGLTDASYSGELKVVDDPVHFYSNIDQFIVPGDVVLLQNDWPDNYK